MGYRFFPLVPGFKYVLTPWYCNSEILSVPWGIIFISVLSHNSRWDLHTVMHLECPDVRWLQRMGHMHRECPDVRWLLVTANGTHPL
jgi:hypothetical protein